jgi:hypothetical protein
VEKLGETPEYGWQLLHLLALDGWQVSEYNVGNARGVKARLGEAEFWCLAPSFPEAALDVFEACVAWKRPRSRDQLSLLDIGRDIEH